jgi:hypothetical protein
MGLWRKAEVAVTTDIMDIIVHSITSATDKNIIAGTKTTVIGMIMARGKNIDRMAIESVYNTDRGI